MWIVTSSLFVGVAATLLYIIYGMLNHHGSEELLTLIPLVVVLVAVLIGCEGYAPQCLEVGDGRIVVVRRYNSVVLRREEIVSVRQLSPQECRGTIRLMGNGGLFGYTGTYWARSIGRFSLYTTSMRNLFLIETTTHGRVVVGCDEPQRILDFWQK